MPRSFPDGSRPGFTPGDLFGSRYELRELIGEGGMGRVYRAEQRSPRRSVAVKFLRPSLVDDADMLRRFHSEARTASLLSHPNLVAVIDFGVAVPGGPFLVMEYVRGASLTRILADDGPLALHRAANLLDQILAALDAAHRADVVHADITSDNVLVAPRGLDEQVKIIDFGLARLRQGGVASDGKEVLAGTPEYLAPEVICGGPPSVGSDLYGAGIILFELLTGTTPFRGGTVRQILTRQATESVIPPSLQRPERPIPAALEEVVMRALAKDPAARYPDAASFRAALAAAIERMTRDRRPAGKLGGVGHREHDHRVRRQYRTIALAVERGALEDITDGYLQLARALVRSGRLAVAIHELEEGIDVVSVGRPLAAVRPAPAVARLLAGLAGLHGLAGNHARARRAAIQSHWVARRRS